MLNLFKRNKQIDDLANKHIIRINGTDIAKNCVAVENYKGVLQYICGDVQRSIKLTTYLKNELTELFGKHNTRFRGEYFYYVWIVEFDGEIFQIFTANGKGASISIVANYEDDKSTVCINFLRKLEEMLDSIKTI